LPAQPRRAEVDALDLRLRLLLRGDVEEVQLVGGEPVAGKWVGARRELGTPAAGRRRFEEMYFLALARLDAERRQRLRIGRPRQHAVGEVALAVLAQLDLLALLRAHEDVALLDEGGPRAVGRTALALGVALALG